MNEIRCASIYRAQFIKVVNKLNQLILNINPQKWVVHFDYYFESLKQGAVLTWMCTRHSQVNRGNPDEGDENETY